MSKNGKLDEAILLNFSKALKQELLGEIESRIALRKAVLGIIFLIQQDQSQILQDYIDFLLMTFPPLSEHFDDNKHPLINEEKIMRARNEETISLLIRADFLEKL